jgi:hypothetical protein
VSDWPESRPYRSLYAARIELRDMLAYWRDAHSAESRRRVRLAIRDVRAADRAAWARIGELAR